MILGSEYGLEPNSARDSGPGLRMALAEAGEWTRGSRDRCATVRLEPGTYRVEPVPGKDYALGLSGVSSVALSAPGATLLFTDPHVGAISLVDTVDVRLEGFAIDYAAPSFTQGLITEVDRDGGTFWFVPMEGYPTFDDTRLFVGTGYGTVREGTTGEMKRDSRITFMISYGRTPRPDGSWPVSVEESNRRWMSDIEVGDGFVTGHRGEIHGISLLRTTDTAIIDVRIVAAPCAAIISDSADGTLLQRVTVARDTGSGRWISSNADAFHSQGGRRGPTVVDCDFAGMHDDGVNIYAVAHAVISGEAATVRIGRGAPVLPGDRVQVFEPSTGLVRAEAAVVDARSSAEGQELTLDAEVPGLRAGDDLFNRSASGAGFSISNTHFHDFRGIGIRMKASDGTITGNQFARLAGPAIWVANDPAWHEGPVGSSGLRISHNAVVDAPLDRSLWEWPESAAAIMFAAFSRANELSDSIVHQAIVLEQNRVDSSAKHAVYVGNADDVRIRELDLTVSSGAEPTALAVADSAKVSRSGVRITTRP